MVGFDFESSSTRTPQYLEFHRVFKREFTQLLHPYISAIEISKPNHFGVSGFFELPDKRIFYFSIGDLRWCKNSMLIRTATSFKDYTGGRNNDIPLDKDFVANFLGFISREGF